MKYLLLIASLVAGSTILAAETAKRADALADAVGVNTHFGATYSNYMARFSTTSSLMQQMGVRHYRDGLVYLDGQAFPGQSYAAFQALGSLGISGDYGMSCGKGASKAIQMLSQMNNVEAIEYPNEYDISGDPNWVATLQGCGPQMKGLLSTYPQATLVGPSLVQMGSPALLGTVPMTVNNLHSYLGNFPPDLSYSNGYSRSPNAGGGPCLQNASKQWDCFPGLRFDIDNVQSDGPGITPWITETGYETSGTPSTPGYGQYVPASYGAVYSVRQILWALAQNIPRVYFYELLDDDSGTFGLVDGNMTPKPAFYALTNLISMMNDPVNFAPQSLNYTIKGGDTYFMHELFQRSDGTFYLAMWLRESDWDGANGISPSPEWITVSMTGHTILSSELLQENGSFYPSSINSTSVDQKVTTAPIFLKIQ